MSKSLMQDRHCQTERQTERLCLTLRVYNVFQMFSASSTALDKSTRLLFLKWKVDGRSLTSQRTNLMKQIWQPSRCGRDSGSGKCGRHHCAIWLCQILGTDCLMSWATLPLQQDATSVPALIHPVARPNFLDLATMKILMQRSSNFKHYQMYQSVLGCFGSEGKKIMPRFPAVIAVKGGVTFFRL